MFAQINQVTLHYRRQGNAAQPALVFINSLGSDFRIWDAVVANFSADFQILCYDKRGHGLSDAPTGPYTMQDHSLDLKGLLEHLHIAKATLIGISVGGMIAQDFALRYPQQTQAIVLCDTGAKIGTEESWNARIEAIQKQGLGEVAKTVIGRWFTPAFFEHRAAEANGYYNMLSRTSIEGYIGTCTALRDTDLRPKLDQIKAPALVLCGESDQSTPPALSEAMAEALGAKLELIPDAAHLPCIEQPEYMSQKIRDFLRDSHVR